MASLLLLEQVPPPQLPVSEGAGVRVGAEVRYLECVRGVAIDMRYDNPNYENNSLLDVEIDGSRYRGQFLIALRDATPEVLEALRDDLLPLYTSPALFRAASIKLGFIRTSPGAAQISASELARFTAALDEWTERFNLRETWVREVAVLTLAKWKSSKADLETLNWANLPFKPPPLFLEDRKLVFQDGGWAVESETWKQFSERVHEAFKHQLRGYRKTIQKQMEDLGLTMPPEIRNLKHYEWLALYQVRGWSPGRIAQEYTSKKAPGGDTVLKAVGKTAGLVGLTIRGSKQGHGPKPRRV